MTQEHKEPWEIAWEDERHLVLREALRELVEARVVADHSFVAAELDPTYCRQDGCWVPEQAHITLGAIDPSGLQAAFHRGFEVGEQRGHGIGYAEGWAQGNANAISAARAASPDFDRGFAEGERRGYDDGYDAGYECCRTNCDSDV